MTNFQKLTQSPEALAKTIISWQRTDPAIFWCNDEYGCANLDEDFDCTNELETTCIMRWLNQEAENSEVE